MHAHTKFPPLPRSAAEARKWVREHLNRIGRHDLVPAAEAGVSELVTNGILHAQTSIGLQLTRQRDRVVIEVYDGSPMVHQPVSDAAAPSTVDSTIGRGLRIVRAYAREWGVSTSTHGKSIWFQPAPVIEGPDSPDAVGANRNGSAAESTRPSTQADEDGVRPPAMDLDAALDALAEAFPEPEIGGGPGADRAGTGEQPMQVWLRGVPPFVVQHYRKRWLELVREMQLVALGEPSAQQQMAQRFCDAAQAVQSDLYLIERSATQLAPVVSDDRTAVDAVFEVRPSMRNALVEIRDMARELEREWAGIQLLFVHPGKQAVQLREWWLGEFIAQIDGAEPTPWPGEVQVRDEALLLRGDA
jgi:anti-sigma regulatory factor (Ser/Thr protein kinase)